MNYISHAPEVLFLALFLIYVSFKTRYRYTRVCSVIFLCMVLYFFRGWDNTIANPSPTTLYCPCDGVVKNIVEKDNHFHIMIFLNIHNIHVQYTPFHCTVKDMKYHKGSFHPAYLLEKSQYNERMEYTLYNPYFGNVTFVQIAGQIARRIKSFVTVNDSVSPLSPIGLIKFGSRCDLLIPKHTNLRIMVKPNDRIRIGNPIAELK